MFQALFSPTVHCYFIFIAISTYSFKELMIENYFSPLAAFFKKDKILEVTFILARYRYFS